MGGSVVAGDGRQAGADAFADDRCEER